MKFGRAVENRDPDGPAISDDWGRRLWPFDVEALCAKARRATGFKILVRLPLNSRCPYSPTVWSAKRVWIDSAGS